MNSANSEIAYILHKRPYRETSTILEIFTRNHGRMSLMARGSRGARSKIAGNLLLFTPLVISWRGKGNLPYLISAERADLKAPVLKNKSCFSAMYINELLMYLLHKDDVHELIFESYHRCLYMLEDAGGLEITLRQFEIKLLELLGFGLNLQLEADTGKAILADRMYEYHFEHGPVISRATSGVTGGVTSGVTSGVTGANTVPRISGACLLALAAEQYQTIALKPKYLAELKQLMRFVISNHLGNKKLKARELFISVANK